MSDLTTILVQRPVLVGKYTQQPCWPFPWLGNGTSGPGGGGGWTLEEWETRLIPVPAYRRDRDGG